MALSPALTPDDFVSILSQFIKRVQISNPRKGAHRHRHVVDTCYMAHNAAPSAGIERLPCLETTAVTCLCSASSPSLLGGVGTTLANSALTSGPGCEGAPREEVAGTLSARLVRMAGASRGKRSCDHPRWRSRQGDPRQLRQGSSCIWSRRYRWGWMI
mmetsp:Transcript_7768/g.16870  ORF Transcript_7768/g.16870 Transcript_7768/m.16870 type:complete len:158 (-) Transcript_7768:247-720(-)